MVSLAQMVVSAGFGAFIGYFTNALAIRSLFRPLKPRWYTLGWQGVIPKNRARLADNIAKVVGEDLLYREYLVEQIERPALQESLRQLLAVRLGRLLQETPADALARLPAPEVERLAERGLGLLAAWSRSEASLGPKQTLLDLLERQVRGLRLHQVVGDNAVEDLLGLLDELLARSETTADLALALERQALAFLERDAPMEEVVPDELREALRQGMRQEIPALLQRLATWLSSREHIDQVSSRLFKALLAYAEREGGMRGLVGGMGLRLFGERIEAIVAERLPAVAREYLASAETRAQVEHHLFAGVDALLKKPIGALVGAEGRPLAAKIGRVAAAWMTSARIRSQVRDLLLEQYRCRRQAALGDLVPDTAWEDMRRRLLELMRLRDDQVASWGLGKRLSEFVAVGREHKGDRRSLRECLALTAADEAALVVWSQGQATELLRREVPVLLEELDIARMVREQVMAFDLLRVEQMVRSLIADQLRYIELLGAVLGAIVGLTLPYLNRLL